MSTPDRSRIGVIVVHEWWGLNAYTISRVHQLNELGYRALAVDMYGNGQAADTPESAQALMMAALAEPEQMHTRFQNAMNQLRPAVDRLYAIGYCFGGAVVLNQARRGTPLDGVASFHGLLNTDQPAVRGQLKAKILVATGGDDPMVNPEQTAAFVREMQSAGACLQLLSYPGVLHGFTNPAATANGKKYNMPLAYDAQADQHSWAALLQFMQ